MSSINGRDALPTIEHAAYVEALSVAYNKAIMASPGDIIFVAGPSGAGKTRLIKALETMLAGDSTDWREGTIPLIRVELDSVNGSACMRSLIIELNYHLGNPFCAPDVGGSVSPSKVNVRLTMTEHALRRSFRCLADQRKLRYVLIDEVQHVNPSKGSYAVARFDSIKMLAGCSDYHPGPGSVVLVLSGHYSMLQLVEYNRQLARRIFVVKVRTYDGTKRSDIVEWERILIRLSELFPIPRERVREMNEVLFKMSCGIFGLLCKIISDADTFRLARRGDEIELRDIREASLSNLDYEAMQKERDGARKVLSASYWEGFIDDMAKKVPASAAKKKSGRRGIRKNGPRDPARKRAS